MNEVKASDVVASRKMVVERNREADLFKRLSPAAKTIFQTALSSTWIGFREEEEILTAVAETLFADAANPLHDLGRAIADANLKGIYKAFLRIPSIAFVADRAPSLWAFMSKKGKLLTEMTGDRSVRVTITHYSDLPRYQIDYIAGYLEHVVVLMGKSGVRVTSIADDPQAWRWDVRWD